jgi:hypothetical protein
MSSAMTAFAIAVGATSLVCYVLMTRLQNRKRDRRSPREGSAPDAGNLAGGASTRSNWFGGSHSAFDGSGNPVDSGGFHSGGGDFGGGGDGGGGGGDGGSGSGD